MRERWTDKGEKKKLSGITAIVEGDWICHVRRIRVYWT